MASSKPKSKEDKEAKLSTSEDLLICKACGTQYDVRAEEGKENCRICDDPRQFVPPTGQAFTTLGEMHKLKVESGDKGGYKNVFRQDPVDERIWEIWTEPKVCQTRPPQYNEIPRAALKDVDRFGIGQRAILIQTAYGNILWDLIAYFDQDTVDQITSLGGLSLILISHPHFYTTWSDWSATFRCPVYLAQPDADMWANRTNPTPPGAELRLLTETHTEVLPGTTAIICGGHFDGSMVLHWEGKLFLADTVFTVAASQNPSPPTAHPKTNTYSFLFSIPNFMPLDPDAILRIWRALKPFEWHTTYGNVVDTMVVREKEGVVGQDGAVGVGVKERMLESAKIAVERMGWGREHRIFAETI